MNLLVLVGVAFFVLGVIVVALLAQDNNDSSTKSATNSNTVDVLEAKEDIPAGTKGEDATTKVTVVHVNASDKQPDALIQSSILDSQLLLVYASRLFVDCYYQKLAALKSIRLQQLLSDVR